MAQTISGHSKECSSSDSGKVYGYMYSNYSGCSNTSLINITTSTATTTKAKCIKKTCQANLLLRHSFQSWPWAKIILLCHGTLLKESMLLLHPKSRGAQCRNEQMCAPKHNVSKDEAKALKEPRQDTDTVIHTAKKEVVMVVLDRQDYISKAMDLLVDSDTYRPLQLTPPRNI